MCIDKMFYDKNLKSSVHLESLFIIYLSIYYEIFMLFKILYINLYCK